MGVITRELQIGKDLTSLKGTGKDFEMILVNQSLQFPAPKTEYIDIPFGDGAIDLTQALTGEVKYHNREGEFTFELLDNAFNRTMQVNKLVNFLQGQRMVLVRPDETDWYYIGRMVVSNIEEAVMVGRLTLSIVAEPYRYKRVMTVKTFDVTTNMAIELNNSRLSLIPEVTATAPVYIDYNGKQISVSAGTHKSLDIKLVEGINKMTIVGTGKVTFKYREGDL